MDAWYGVVRESLNDDMESICDFGYIYNNNIDKYKNKTATTCIFSGIYKETLYVAQAGDGICGIVFDGKLKTLGQRNSDFVNEVNPIRADSNNEGKWNSRIIDLNKYLSLDIFMATDGISDDILPEKLAEFISYIFEHVEMLDSKKRNKYILNILRNWSTPNSHDDKTIAILRWRQYENNRWVRKQIYDRCPT